MEDVLLPKVQTEVFWDCTSELMASEGISEEEALRKLDPKGERRDQYPRPENFPDPQPAVAEAYEARLKADSNIRFDPWYNLKRNIFWTYVAELMEYRGISEQEALQALDRTGQKRTWYPRPAKLPYKQRTVTQAISLAQLTETNVMHDMANNARGRTFWACVKELKKGEGISESEALQKLDLVGIKRSKYPAPDNYPAPQLPKTAVPQFLP